MKRLTLSILLGTLAISGVICNKLSIDPKTRTFRDESGRSRIFHGTNVVVKGHPYIPVLDRFDPQLSLNDQDIQNMKDWGIHLVRLGVMWESVEVAPQQYNYTYLEQVNKLITKLGENGLYTMVDAHQDLYSRKTCGEGMPTFYANAEVETCPTNLPGQILKMAGGCKPLKDYGFRKDAEGLPLIEDCLKNTFIKYYTSPEVMGSFEGLYFNQTIQQRFVDFWDVVSQTLGSNPHIVGYDPINEPWPANFYKDFTLMLNQQKFDREVLFPLLKKVHDVIRKNVNDMIYFFEPAQFPDTLPFMGGIVAHVGFPTTPGGNPTHESLNDHTYCCQASADMCDSGEPPIEKMDQCKAFHAKKVNVRAEDAKRFNVPLVYSEFGACSNTLVCFHEITAAADAFDDHLASWMYWMFKGFGDFTTTGSLTEGYYDGAGNL